MEAWRSDMFRCPDCGVMFNKFDRKKGEASCPLCDLREQLHVPNGKTKEAISGARRGEGERLPHGSDPLKDLGGGGS